MRQVNKKLALLGAGLAGLMITPMMQVGLSAKDAVQVVNRVSDHRKKITAVPNKKRHLHTNRHLTERPFIVRNQRQKRKRWRQTPHTRPARNKV